MKNFHLDLVRVTEAGAISAAEWVGRGNKEKADKAATDAMRSRLNGIDFCAEIAIGEGKKDESYGLFEGERVGFYAYARRDERENTEFEPMYSIAIDPIEGTTPTAKGGYEAMSVIAMAGVNKFYKTECHYMEKFAVGPEVASSLMKVGLDVDPAVNITRIAPIIGKSLEHVTVCVLDRPRNKYLVKKFREVGCRIKFISDCDVTACIATCDPDSGIDVYWSIGGAPEAIISAAAMKCMGGMLQCREWDKEEGFSDKILDINELAKGPTMFAATGITDGKLLEGVRFTKRGPETHSIAMRSESGTIREFKTRHGN